MKLIFKINPYSVYIEFYFILHTLHGYWSMNKNSYSMSSTTFTQFISFLFSFAVIENKTT